MRFGPRRVIGGVAILVLMGGLAGRAIAGPLDPLAFPSLGLFPAGGYIINTDTATISNPFNVPLVTGVISNGIAVLDFDNFAGNPFVVTGSNPLAILSRSDIVIPGVIDVSAPTPTSNYPFSNPGGPGGYGSGNGPGGGGNGLESTNGSLSTPGGGGFGGAGGNGGAFFSLPPPGRVVPGGGGAGGSSYGDLALQLQGGSGGGSVLGSRYGRLAGGGGGGAIELGAIGNITVSGSILANGASGGSGGAGGGIYVHADTVLLNGTLSARGGGSILYGALGGGGGGGGGMILVQTRPDGFQNYGTVDVSGGSGSSTFDGIPFSFAGSPGIGPVPEPSSLVLLGIGVVGTLGAAWLRHERAWVAGGVS
jgi:hypothetical protein